MTSARAKVEATGEVPEEAMTRSLDVMLTLDDLRRGVSSTGPLRRWFFEHEGHVKAILISVRDRNLDRSPVQPPPELPPEWVARWRSVRLPQPSIVGTEGDRALSDAVSMAMAQYGGLIDKWMPVLARLDNQTRRVEVMLPSAGSSQPRIRWPYQSRKYAESPVTWFWYIAKRTKKGAWVKDDKGGPYAADGQLFWGKPIGELSLDPSVQTSKRVVTMDPDMYREVIITEALDTYDPNEMAEEWTPERIAFGRAMLSPVRVDDRGATIEVDDAGRRYLLDEHGAFSFAGKGDEWELRAKGKGLDRGDPEDTPEKYKRWLAEVARIRKGLK